MSIYIFKQENEEEIYQAIQNQYKKIALNIIIYVQANFLIILL